MDTIIVPTCTCNFAFSETGKGDNDRNVLQVYSPDGRIIYSNREENEEMDDLELLCVRCGKLARFGGR